MTQFSSEDPLVLLGVLHGHIVAGFLHLHSVRAARTYEQAGFKQEIVRLLKPLR
jgi:hypothetical protein